ncbi:hypothetical protein HNP38_000090 [Chryseobacterium defluvii]|uniref:Uncharacterized protein n=1 Tax=Chryseobacterium defluvii TaxID=160396 RepID=A0A840KA10_9FLAO|nr:hypothetical protein [Chryseobacterium defluvii]MBB4804818.1 hypothetical protein [Chryseobacterium defluvii]
MATRADVVTKIAAINDSGNNTAREVRDVLTGLLEYTETVPVPGSGSDVDFYHYWEPTSISDPKGAQLWYSFKGISKQTVNFTFRLLIKESNSNNFNFPLNEKLAKELRSIFLTPKNMVNPMSFTVSLNNANPSTGGAANPRTWTMYLFLKENTLNMMLAKEKMLQDGIKAGDEVFTSIHFHCPEFEFEK